MEKSPEAFRTISEVAEALETPAHVLRFWESRFPQIRPVKRAGGRRYYRPADVALLSGIRHLLHDEGMTIRGVQKILREQGVRHVAAMVGGPEVDFDSEAVEPALMADQEAAVLAPEAVASAQVVALETALRRVVAAPVGDGAASAELHQLRPGLAAKAGVIWPETGQPDDFSLEGIFSFGPKPDRSPEVPMPGSAAPAPPKAVVPVPEAPHVWVDAEPELELPVPVKLPAPVKLHGADRSAESALPGGAAARLRALPRPVSEPAAGKLAELHSRLSLLHAQMAEALRLRR